MNKIEDIASGRKYSGEFLSNEEIKEILRKLEIYYRITDPKYGEPTEKDKDLHAFLAITLGSRLFETVAGWAIDHQVGLAAVGRGPSFRGHPSVRVSHAIDDEARKSNAHIHEITGREPKQLSATQKRQALINIIQGAQGFIPEHIYTSLTENLEALKLGYKSSIFEYRPASNKLKFRQRQLILKGIAFASYRQARDSLRSMPGIDIVEAFGLEGQKTFSGWLRKSTNIFGEFRVNSAIAWAKDAGLESRKHLKLKRQGKQGLAEEYARNEAIYGDPAIGDAAAEFRSLAPRRREPRIGQAR
ncbi:hypothetical protein [Nostoc linckia]|uniref:hypothetical protein n=1 Tax=Nostoc linckia TaxID=92942 RepID=UPI000BFFC578|nr:hypothetical protein [Nostoc linckia]PHJ94370.1 hypothetical protein VF09_37090 [Nostoc linckia z9]